MDSEAAAILLYSLAGVGLLVWLASVEYLRRTRLQPSGDAAGLGVRDFFPEAASSEGWLLGSATLDGNPSTLSDRVTAALAGAGALGFGPVKVTGKSDRQVDFEWPGPALMGQQRVWWFRRGQLRFGSLGGDTTRVAYAVELKPIQRWLRLAALLQFFGLLWVVALFWLLHTFVVSANEVGLRWQVIQMVQSVHLLWPPFLFVTLYRRARENVATRLDTFLHNLPYLAQSA